jgi:uncharacterized protein YhaN
MLFNTLKFQLSGTGTGDDGYDFNLNDILNSIGQHDARLNATLTKQSQVDDLLNAEIGRLEKKETQIEDAQAGQKRVLMLNESYRMRQAEYTKLIIASVFVFAIVILIKYLRASFTILPDTVYTLIHIILFSALIIYAMVIYINVSSREKTNFNRLNIPTPDVVKSAEDKRRQKRKDAGYLTGISDSELCRGAACCSVGQTFVDGKCT